MPIVNPNDVMVLERGKQNTPITLQLVDTNAAMNRLHEIKSVNLSSFPELITSFIEANRELTQAIATVRQELIKTEFKLNQLRANLLINEVPAVIESKGLKNTADISNSVMLLDENYSDLVYTVEVYEGALLILEGKVKTLRDAQFAIRDIANMNFASGPKKLELKRKNTADVYDFGEF